MPTQPSQRVSVTVEKRRPPGVRRLAFYCDESGISGNLRHYGFCALIMQYQRRGEFVEEFAKLARNRDLGEVKWNKTSNGNLDYYKHIVDYFFESSSLFFHCIVVERAWVNVKKFHEGSFDLARRKHFTTFLANKVKRIVRLDPKREYEFRVYVDPIASSYRKADEAVQVIGNNVIRKDLKEDRTLLEAAKASPIQNVLTVDSKERPEIQLGDLLLGAVVDSWNETASGPAKASLKKHIASYLNWDDLRAGTYAQERKFNVWWLTDQFDTDVDRKVRARPIKLLHELPKPRRYTPGG